MRKTIAMLVMTSALLAGMSSCKKEETPKEAIKQTINVSLKNTESYSFILPENLRDDKYEITTSAGHSSISQVSINSEGKQIYKYTPATGYVGNEQVVISNDQEREEFGSHHHPGPPPSGPKPGGCKGGEEDHYIITINFVVDKSEIIISQ